MDSLLIMEKQISLNKEMFGGGCGTGAAERSKSTEAQLTQRSKRSETQREAFSHAELTALRSTKLTWMPLLSGAVKRGGLQLCHDEQRLQLPFWDNACGCD